MAGGPFGRWFCGWETYQILLIRTLVVIVELIVSLLLVNYLERKKYSKASEV